MYIKNELKVNALRANFTNVS